MKINLSKIARALMFAGISFAATASYAGLILVTAEDFGGTGLGAVNTVLTIQNSPSESGSVSFGDILTGDAKRGASQSDTKTLGELGVTSAQTLRIVFNAVEPGAAGNGIVLTALTLNIYSPTGTTLFTTGLNQTYSFNNTFNGTGNSGFVFALDQASVTAAQTAAFGAGFANNVVGLSLSATESAGGNETLFVADSIVTGPPRPSAAIPEPTSVALLGLGLAGLAFSLRKKA